MQNSMSEAEYLQFQLHKVKQLLSDACVEIADWKTKAKDLERENAALIKKLTEVGERTVRLPLGMK